MKAGNFKLSFNEFMVVLDNISLSSEDRDLLKTTSKVNYDFIGFLANKFNTSELAAEAIMEINTSQALRKYINENDDFDTVQDENAILKVTAKVIATYAKDAGFPDYEKLESFTLNFFSIFAKFNQ
jgi:hypothetical protein